MNVLRMEVSGLKFRAGDGNLKVATQLKLIKQRSAPFATGDSLAVSFRRGDDRAKLAGYLARRQPINLNISEITGVSAAAEIKIPKMVTIPAGKFIMGSNEYSDEKPIRTITISKAFGIGKYEVTNDEYKLYLEVAGQEVPELVAESSNARHPVVNVSWNDASAYCKWLSGQTARKYRLPTEAEGEYAARGAEGRKYPWGKDFDASKATFNTNGTRPVDAHPEGASPFEVMDLSGNVWEWRADWYGAYNPEDLTDPKGTENGKNRVLRGGSWYYNDSDSLRSAYRNSYPPALRNDNVGFRVAEDLG